MNYEEMSVHELVEVLLDYVNSGSGWGTIGDETPAIESALRKAVIREASVGNATIRIRLVDGGPIVRETTLKEKEAYDWRVYDLIPKETP